MKSAATLQSWPGKQKTFGFDIGPTKRDRPPLIDDDPWRADPEPTWCDIYVLAGLTLPRRDPQLVLDVANWEFWVLTRDQIQGAGVKRLSESRLRALGVPAVRFDELGAAIRTVA